MVDRKTKSTQQVSYWIARGFQNPGFNVFKVIQFNGTVSVSFSNLLLSALQTLFYVNYYLFFRVPRRLSIQRDINNNLYSIFVFKNRIDATHKLYILFRRRPNAILSLRLFRLRYRTYFISSRASRR